MENDFAAPDPPSQSPPATTRDPLIRYSVFAALGCAAVCMIFTILYVFSYSLDSTLSFERHFDSYLAAGNAANLPTVLGLHMAQNRMFLQSCGMVAGIFFAFLGLALFLLGIQGTVDASGQIKDYSASVRRLAPGGIILLSSMIFVGVSAMHPVEFILGPSAPSATILAPSATAAPPASAPPAPSSAPTQPAPTTAQTSPTSAPSTQSQPQPAPTSATQQAPHLAPQSAQTPATMPSPAQPTPATSPVQHPTPRPALVPIKQNARTTPPPTQHRFQP